MLIAGPLSLTAEDADTCEDEADVALDAVLAVEHIDDASVVSAEMKLATAERKLRSAKRSKCNVSSQKNA